MIWFLMISVHWQQPTLNEFVKTLHLGKDLAVWRARTAQNYVFEIYDIMNFLGILAASPYRNEIITRINSQYEHT